MTKKKATAVKCVSFEEFQPSLFPVDPTPSQQEATKREGLAVFDEQLNQAYGDNWGQKATKKAK